MWPGGSFFRGKGPLESPHILFAFGVSITIDVDEEGEALAPLTVSTWRARLRCEQREAEEVGRWNRRRAAHASTEQTPPKSCTDAAPKSPTKG